VSYELKDEAKRQAARQAGADARDAEWKKELADLAADGATARDTAEAVSRWKEMKHLNLSTRFHSKVSDQYEKAQVVAIAMTTQLVESATQRLHPSIRLKQFKYGADGQPFFQQG
jgi:hypothetical protein